MTQTELAFKINTLKNQIVPLSISPFQLGEILEALIGTSSETPISLQEIVERDSYGEFPTEGTGNTIYIDLSDDKMYRWDGTTYVPLNDTSSTLTIRSLADLDEQLSVGVFTVLWIRKINNKTIVVSYTLRIESSPGMISQYLENTSGYSSRTYMTSSSSWLDWQEVTFATTDYVDSVLGEIATLLSEV